MFGCFFWKTKKNLKNFGGGVKKIFLDIKKKKKIIPALLVKIHTRKNVVKNKKDWSSFSNSRAKFHFFVLVQSFWRAHYILIIWSELTWPKPKKYSLKKTKKYKKITYTIAFLCDPGVVLHFCSFFPIWLLSLPILGSNQLIEPYPYFQFFFHLQILLLLKSWRLGSFEGFERVLGEERVLVMGHVAVGGGKVKIVEMKMLVGHSSFVCKINF